MRFKLGRKRPDPTARRFAFAKYKTADLPAPPDKIHWQVKGDHLENVFGNDKLGDCTAAGAGHAISLWRGAADNKDRMPTTADVIAFYSATTGYVPGEPWTDQGGDEVTVLNHWKSKGFFSDGTGQIKAWVTVDASNELEVKQAMWLAESLYFGVELPDRWISPFPSSNGFVWDIAGDPNPNNGHCFVGIGYGPAGDVIIDSWGMFGRITPAAMKTYAGPHSGGELYAMFSEDAINRGTQKAPNGFDFGALLADSASL